MMKWWRSIEPPRRLRIIGVTILAAGLVSAAIIYIRATPPPGDPIDYGLDTSKQYLREVEVYGGTANVLATQIREWFDSLWQGQRLAGTIATLCSLISLGFFFVASHTPKTRP